MGRAGASILELGKKPRVQRFRTTHRAEPRFLDTAVRLLRKKGAGLRLVSQKISDFDPAIRSAMSISILFRTKYEGDLRATARVLRNEGSEVISKLPVGFSIFHLADNCGLRRLILG